jgi:hypothetical protein
LHQARPQNKANSEPKNRLIIKFRLINAGQRHYFMCYPDLALQININDLQGRRLKSWSFSNAAGVLQLNLNGLAPGYYQLELTNNKGEKELHRLLKQ